MYQLLSVIARRLLLWSINYLTLSVQRASTSRERLQEKMLEVTTTDMGIWVGAPSLTVMIFNTQNLPNLTSSENSFKTLCPVSICTSITFEYFLTLSYFLAQDEWDSLYIMPTPDLKLTICPRSSDSF